MQSVNLASMQIIFTHTGLFARRNKDIWWIEIKNNDKLMSLQKELIEALASYGFNLDKTNYKPHITLARQVKTSNHIKEEDLLKEPFLTQINSISLIHSHRIDDKLIYTEIFKVSTHAQYLNILSN